MIEKISHVLSVRRRLKEQAWAAGVHIFALVAKDK